MTTVAWVLFAIIGVLAALQCYTSALASRTIRNLEARLGALTLARTPAEYVGLMHTPTDPPARPKRVKTRRGREIDASDDRDQVPTTPIGLSGGVW